TGRKLESLGAPAAFSGVRFSADSRKVVVAETDWRSGSSDLWIYDRQTGIPTRFTTDPRLADNPFWSWNGEFLFFRSALDGP
ncbi:TolB family protein, partial [Salmonella sp. SAL4357]|uniref:TolB family protein n=1 Tax=Salmonella sp. SAL4357 TaxID=3159878 RepID=UPI00397B7606